MNHLNDVMLGLSGGVDSATSAFLLMKQGYRVQPILMHNWQDDVNCSIEADLKDCQNICSHLGLSLEVVNFSKLYRQEVFNYCLKLFKQGLTPNPDILCNRQIKFAALKNHAHSMGYHYLATGHYARIEKRDGENALLCAPDLVKDQTYFLSQLTQSQLEHVLFPIGHLEKQSVRQIALDAHLPNAQKKDSTGICFIGERRFDQFLQEHLLTKPGPAIDQSGNQVGTHKGLFFYTLGQRRRLGIGGIKDAEATGWYVVAKNLATNELVLTQNKDDLLKSFVRTEPIHWIRTKAALGEKLECKLRHGPSRVEVYIHQEDHGAVIEFLTPQEAPTPGQYIVLYRGNECIGSTMILEQLS